MAEFARKYDLLEVMSAKFAWEIRGEHDMIIQTGMRTDIPAFYSEWLVNRIEEASTEWDIKRPLIKSANTQKIVMAIEVKMT